MRIADILKRGVPSVSFEVFPPKKDAAFEPVKEAVARLADARPSFISVTYGAGGGANTNTAAIAEFVTRECHTTALAHLTCCTSSRAKIADETAALKRSGVENVLCLRGDFPPDATPETRAFDFAHAADLVRALKKDGDFCLGGACYPECHPECAHIEEDIAHLREKVDAGLDFLTTQMFFDNAVYFQYLARLRTAQVNVPVIAGIMPVTNGRQIDRICRLSGTYLPPRFKAIVDRFGDNPAAMMDAGIAYATEQIIDLFAHGVQAVHIYTMNKPETGARIMGNISGLLG